ncbi:hypothetical protein HYC85_006717 [Camellia sinensis]|uniref:Uncharacterized protein n=1 Tax=Camellia sinensis TaxID=4442 RepID=A0A7J7HNS1_CAMSI|nr:hypothetical protein HYC85_006717 [Camellia sinensis]
MQTWAKLFLITSEITLSSPWQKPKLQVGRSRSPPRRERIVEREEKRARSYSRRPMLKRATTPPSKTRKHSPTPEEEEEKDIVRERDNSPSPKRGRPETEQDRSDYSESPRENSRSPVRESPAAERYQSPSDANGRSRSHNPTASPRDNRSPVDDDDNHQSPRGPHQTPTQILSPNPLHTPIGGRPQRDEHTRKNRVKNGGRSRPHALHAPLTSFPRAGDWIHALHARTQGRRRPSVWTQRRSLMEESTSTSGSMIKLNASNYAIWKPKMEDNGVKPTTKKDEDWKRKNRKTIGQI